MEKYINIITDFLEASPIKANPFLSLIFEADEINFSFLLNNVQDRNEAYFYTTHVKEDISFLGFDSVFQISANGESRLKETDEKIKELGEKIISNWNKFNLRSIPLFMGGIKFSVEKPNELWNDFSDSEWFVPKFLFLKQNNKPYLVYNSFVKNLSDDKINSDFELLSTIVKKKTTTKSLGKIKSHSNRNEKKSWITNVNTALSEIRQGEVQKIVLSRQINLELDATPSISQITATLGERYPKCYVFAFKKNNSIFFGASPEKLAKISDGWIEADALAGSISRGRTGAEDDSLAQTLLTSKKDLAEQKIVVSFIKNSFSQLCDKIIFEEKPIIRKLPNIQHLWTPIRGRINSNHSIFSILKWLHPTPAICGVPWEKARSSIRKMESHNRGLYTGMIGWFNLNNEGEFAVAIRSALLKENKISAFAGCGIVEGSEPEVEYAESELKLNPIISLFERIK